MWKKFFELTKWIIGVGAFVTFVITSYQSLTNLHQKEIQSLIKQSNDSTAVHFQKLDRKIDRISRKQDEMVGDINNIRENVIVHVSRDKSVTKDDLYKFMKEIGSEIQKNNVAYKPYPLVLIEDNSQLE